ncbi:MAG: regulatory protein RecX [Dehalococcoidia bacterium]|nr:regulatory protein RecX [Dehalococcoidia bacterium]
MIITALERARRRNRFDVYVNGRFALALGVALAQEQGLHAGMEVTEQDLQALRKEDERRRAYEAALNLLSYRPRSERELRLRLRRRRFEPATIDETVERLKTLHYLDDAAFAEFWRESRDIVSPRSGRLIRSELLSKGVDSETATAAIEGLDDEDAAYRAARKRLSALAGESEEVFRRRLSGFLARRGFNYDVVRRTVDRCLREMDEGMA